MTVFQCHSPARPTISADAAKEGVVAVDTSYRTVRYGLIEQWSVYAPHTGMVTIDRDGRVGLCSDPIRTRRVDPRLARHTTSCINGVYSLPVQWQAMFAAKLVSGVMARCRVIPGTCGDLEWA